jgi:hypothetical protein
MVVPSGAFTSADELQRIAENNPAWVDGYKMGMGVGQGGALPSPGPTDTWATYWASLSILKDPIQGDSDVGYNNAIENGANWIWINDPVSPHNA